MVKISKVEVQAKNKSRVNVYVDGEFYTGLDLDTCVKYGLKANYEIEQERLDDIVKESERQSALSKSVKYMSRALKTTKQIKDYLKGKGYDSQTIEYCILKLNEYNYLNDANYVRAFVKDNYKRAGINKIRHMLEAKGVSKKILDEELESYKDFDIQVLDSKIQLTSEAVTKLRVVPGDRISINY